MVFWTNTPPSLHAFARVNWASYYAASAYLFHTLHFEVNESQDVINLTEEYSKRLERAFAFGHVRCIEIHDRLDEEMPNQTARSRRSRRRTQRRIDSEIQRNEGWLPLATLVKRLSGLSDLIFGGSHKLPICLLNALHQRHQRCRLHMRRFRPRNSDGSPVAEGKLNSSPCLHSIQYAWTDDIGYDRYMPQADHELVMRVISGLAPNLKEVICDHWGPPAEFADSSLAGFQPVIETHSQASLNSLSLLHSFAFPTSEIHDWMSCTDFSALESLRLQQDCRKESTLRYLIANAHLPRLKTLSLRMKWKYEGFPSAETSENAREFLQWLPPLRSLTFLGWSLREIPMDSILVHHGPCLVDLFLAPCPGLHPTSSDLRQIVENCPVLENLAISIRRTYGDGQEVALYRALGSLPKLQHLTLDLDVSEAQCVPIEPTPEDSDDEASQVWIPFDVHALPDHDLFREFDLEPCAIASNLSETPINGRVRGALINTAIDKALACSIFEAISAGKPKMSLPLKRLDVKAIRVGEFVGNTGNINMSCAMVDIFNAIAKEWRVERNPRDDTDGLVAKEIGEPERFLDPNMRLVPELTKVWRSLWPEHESGDWKNEWHSFPLSI